MLYFILLQWSLSFVVVCFAVAAATASSLAHTPSSAQWSLHNPKKMGWHTPSTKASLEGREEGRL